MLGSEVLEVIIVSMVVVSVRFCFCFDFSGVSVVVPVHVLKRKARLKPATTAHFF